MRKSIFDILNKEMNFESEFWKLVFYFSEDNTISYNMGNYTLQSLFDEFIEEWEYRGTYIESHDILDALDLSNTVYLEDDYIEKCLVLIELILNVKEFLTFKQSQFENEYRTIIDSGNLNGICSVPSIKFSGNILYKNIDIILSKLGYKWIKRDKYKVLLIKDNANAISTALIMEDKDMSSLILEYNDFRIEKDLKSKKDILLALGQYIEPLKNKIKDKNANLKDYIFYGLNNLHLRHNNKNGKDKIEYIANMKNEELIKWYDNLYDLILIAIRLVELPNIFNEFENLKTNCIAMEEKIN